MTDKGEWIVPLTVNETIIPFKLDTGAQVNLLSMDDYRTFSKKQKLFFFFFFNTLNKNKSNRIHRWGFPCKRKLPGDSKTQGTAVKDTNADRGKKRPVNSGTEHMWKTWLSEEIVCSDITVQSKLYLINGLQICFWRTRMSAWWSQNKHRWHGGSWGACMQKSYICIARKTQRGVSSHGEAGCHKENWWTNRLGEFTSHRAQEKWFPENVLIQGISTGPYNVIISNCQLEKRSCLSLLEWSGSVSLMRLLAFGSWSLMRQV